MPIPEIKAEELIRELLAFFEQATSVYEELRGLPGGVLRQVWKLKGNWMQVCLGVISLKQTYRLIANNYRSAFPHLCSYPQWIARLQALPMQVSALLTAATRIPKQSPAFYLIEAKPLPVCRRIRHGRVRLLREDGAYFGKTSKGWFFGFKLHVIRHIDERIVNLVLTPGNWDDRGSMPTLLDGVNGGVILGDLG